MLGHNHPRVTEAIANQLAAFGAVPPGFDYDLREELLEALSFIIPVPLTHVSFTESGSAAVDLAITWIAAASDRPRVIAMQRSDHGAGIGGRGVSGGKRGRRCRAEPRGDSGAVRRSRRAERADGLRASQPCSSNRYRSTPAYVFRATGYLASVAELCRSVGALLVVDEVRTALRMGPSLASAAQGVGPDIVCLGSSLANGLPFGVMAVGPSVSRKTRMPRREHDEACPPLVCAAANATIRTALGPTLRALAELASERLQGRLRALRLGEIREVRGCGAMVAIETSLNAPMLLRRLEQRGLLALPGGTGTVRLLPPLILERREADGVVEAIAAIILASRPPRRRSVSAPATDEIEVVLPGRSTRRRASGRALTDASRPTPQLRRSTIIAIPWPPPTHIVSSPMVASAVCRSLRSVQRIRAPVMPNGWPSAIAPPWGLRRSSKGSMPMPRADGITCAANASLISTTCTSSMVMPRPRKGLTGGLDRTESHELRLERGESRGDDPGERRDAELARTCVRHDHDRGRAVVERAGVARCHGAVLAEDRLELGELLEGGLATGTVVLGHSSATVGQFDGHDLAIEEAVVLRGDRTLLAAQRESVHLLAADLLAGCDVLGGLAHRDVDVRVALGVAGLEPLVPALGHVARAVDEARDALDADAEKDVALAGADGVRGHASRLQRGRAVAGDGGPRRVDPGQDADDATEVEALLATRKSAAADEILDRVSVQLREAVEHLVDDAGGEVVGPDVDERSFHRTSDG